MTHRILDGNVAAAAEPATADATVAATAAAAVAEHARFNELYRTDENHSFRTAGDPGDDCWTRIRQKTAFQAFVRNTIVVVPVRKRAARDEPEPTPEELAQEAARIFAHMIRDHQVFVVWWKSAEKVTVTFEDLANSKVTTREKFDIEKDGDVEEGRVSTGWEFCTFPDADANARELEILRLTCGEKIGSFCLCVADFFKDGDKIDRKIGICRVVRAGGLGVLGGVVVGVIAGICLSSCAAGVVVGSLVMVVVGVTAYFLWE